MIQETLERAVLVNGELFKVLVKHEGFKAFEEQHDGDGLWELDMFLSEELMKPLNEQMRFVPYDNFECSFTWEIID